MGGEIRLVSNVNEGSNFTLYLPEDYFASASGDFSSRWTTFNPAPLVVQHSLKPEEIADDRETILPKDAVVLIVEDDPRFAGLLLDLVREQASKP